MGIDKRRLFRNSKEKNVILDGVYKDYTYKNMSAKEIAEKYGYTVRQIRYFLDRYLLVKKGKGRKKNMNIEKVDDDIIIIDGKVGRKTTVEDLLERAKNLNLKKKDSTNKKVENK